ncbi:MAG: hypothetical protein JW744_04675 [Candidatus Diapherotrites archaeon]|uniref:Uncharacterized protein n=1 Tax=Candidatus Iainarchaeum sp. TaxID=3101447 RepID=A0A938YXY8_9ARCH|nr:hypothetical protein [Candidatus Diapherotrites archaeon]
MRSHIFILFALISISLTLPAAFAEQNITELKVVEVSSPIRSGEAIDFAFSAGNMSGPPCSAQLTYWLGSSQKLEGGKDNLYLATGQSVTETVSFTVPSNLEGQMPLYLEMVCNDANILASRMLEVKRVLPAIPRFTGLAVDRSIEGQEVEFSFGIESSRQLAEPLVIEEQILQSGAVVWERTQRIEETVQGSFTTIGPVLPIGEYQLIVKSAYAGETTEVARRFSMRPVPFQILPILTLASLALLFAAAAVITVKFIFPRGSRFKQGIFPGGRPALLPRAHAKKGSLCIVESESSGILDEVQTSKLFDEAGLKGKRRAASLAVAGRIPVEQLVRSCVVTGKGKGVSCNTTVSAVVSNNTNRNWKKLELLVSIPEFISEDISEVEAGENAMPLKGSNVLKFSIDKIGAMQSATISYSFPKLVSQAEANSIPLPAVIKCGEGQPLVVAQVRVEKAADSTEWQNVKDKAVAKLPKGKRAKS